MKLKKFLALLLALLLALSMVACGNNDDDDDDDDDDDKKSSISDSERDEDKDNKDDDKDDSTLTKTGTEVFNDEGLTVTYEGFDEDALFGAEIAFEVKNENDETLYLNADYCSVNGFMNFAMFGGEIKGGETQEIKMSLSSSDMEACGIKTVRTIEFFLEVSDTDYNSLAKSDRITLTLSNKKDSAKDFSKDAELLLDKDGIKVYALSEINEDGILGHEAYLYVVNDSDQYITVTDDDGVMVNGQETTAFFISDLYPGTKAVVDITIYEEDMQEKNISKIETLELAIQIYESNTYEDLFPAKDVTVEYK